MAKVKIDPPDSVNVDSASYKAMSLLRKDGMYLANEVAKYLRETGNIDDAARRRLASALANFENAERAFARAQCQVCE